MAMKGYSTLPKFPELNTHHQMKFSSIWHMHGTQTDINSQDQSGPESNGKVLHTP